MSAAEPVRQPEPPPERPRLREVPPPPTEPPPRWPVPKWLLSDDGSADPLCFDHPRRDELWFSEMRTASDIANAREAAQLCLQCPVLIRCRDWAAYYKPYSGIWGGIAYVASGDSTTGVPAKRSLLPE